MTDPATLILLICVAALAVAAVGYLVVRRLV